MPVFGAPTNGVIAPVATATANRAYPVSADRRHQIDIRVPDTPGDYDCVHPAGIGSDIPGQTVAKARDGKRYACRLPSPALRAFGMTAGSSVRG